MTVANRTVNQLRIDGLLLNAHVIEIGRHLRAYLLTSLFAVFLSALFVSPASAAVSCSAGVVNLVVAAGTISIPANASPGTVVKTLGAQSFVMACQFQNTSPYNTSATTIIHFTVNNAPATGFTDVYPTSISGLGIRFVFNVATCNTSNLSLNNKQLDISCPLSGSLGGQWVYVYPSVTPSLVIYGAVKAGASSLTSIPVVNETYTTSDSGSSYPQPPVYTGSASGTVNTIACSVQTKSLAVSLPTPSARDFAAGVGAVAGRTAFDLNFTCPTGVQISIVITDAVTPANRSNVLTLSSESTVKGIGLQVLKGDGTPVLFGPDAADAGVANQWVIGPSPNGAFVLPLSAQYIRTGNVSPGSLKALATFTMSYN